MSGNRLEGAGQGLITPALARTRELTGEEPGRYGARAAGTRAAGDVDQFQHLRFGFHTPGRGLPS